MNIFRSLLLLEASRPPRIEAEVDLLRSMVEASDLGSTGADCHSKFCSDL